MTPPYPTLASGRRLLGESVYFLDHEQRPLTDLVVDAAEVLTNYAHRDELNTAEKGDRTII